MRKEAVGDTIGLLFDGRRADHGGADDVINAQDGHLKEAEKAGDATHQEARDAMKGRWRHPKKSMGWYRDMKKAFSELPED